MHEKTKYYWIHFDDSGSGGVAKLLNAKSCGFIEIANLIDNEIEFGFSRGEITDYLGNDLGFPLISMKFRKIIDNVSDGQALSWVRTKVHTEFESIEYFFPKFLNRPDILDLKNTKFIEGPLGPKVLKAVLSIEKVQHLDFFPMCDSDVSWIISRKLRRAATQAKVTGIAYSSARISTEFNE